LVLARSLPSVGPAERDARRCLPSSGSRGPWFPTFLGTMRREDCHPTRLGSLRSSLASRYLACFRAFVVALTGSCSGGSPRPRQGFWSPGPPVRAYGPGERWLSHVPEFPLCMHAPLSDPGGVLPTRHIARRTAAFRRVPTVGFPLHTTLSDILVSTTLHLSGLHHAACLLAPSSFVLPLLGWHVEFAPDLLARRSSGGT
jgi:hypothetical protein